MAELPAATQRIYLILTPGEGKLSLSLSPLPPDAIGPTETVLLVRGQLPQDWPVSFDIALSPPA